MEGSWFEPESSFFDGKFGLFKINWFFSREKRFLQKIDCFANIYTKLLITTVNQKQSHLLPK